MRSGTCYAIIIEETEKYGETMRRERGRERGQVLAEYAALLVMFALVAITMLLLLAVFTEYGWRITALVGWEPEF